MHNLKIEMYNQVIYAATPLICKIQTQIQLADEVDLQEFTQRLTKGILWETVRCYAYLVVQIFLIKHHFHIMKFLLILAIR